MMETGSRLLSLISASEQSRATIMPPAKCHSNGISLVDSKWPIEIYVLFPIEILAGTRDCYMYLSYCPAVKAQASLGKCTIVVLSSLNLSIKHRENTLSLL